MPSGHLSLYQERLPEGTHEGGAWMAADTKDASKCPGTLVLYSRPVCVCKTEEKEAAWSRLGTF